MSTTVNAHIYFNPRSQQRERPNTTANTENSRGFQSTLPAKGATREVWLLWDGKKISIHAPSKGSDAISADLRARALQFQSTLPAKGAT